MDLESYREVLGDDPKVARCLRLLARDPRREPEITRRLLAEVRRRGMDPADLPVFPPRRPEELAGDVQIGLEVQTGVPVGLRLDKPTHILIRGQSGTGKTTFERRILAGLAEGSACTCRVLDVLGTFADFPTRYPGWVRLEEPLENVFLPPEQVQSRVWLGAVLETMGSELGLMLGARATVQRILSQELAEAFAGGAAPAIADVRDHLRSLVLRRRLNQTDAGYIQRSLPRFDALIAELPRTPGIREGILGALQDVSIVFDMSRMTVPTRNFLAQVLILRDYFVLLADPERRQRPVYWVVDEAAALFSSRYDRLYEEVTRPLDTVVRQARNVGLYIIAGTQEPSAIGHAFKANAQTHAVFRLSDGADLAEVCQALSFGPRERQAIGDLEVGEAVVRFGDRGVTAKVRMPL